MIHDKRDEENWSDEVGNWEDEFDTDDVVIGPGYGSYRTMIMVHEINLDLVEHVTHRGIFWKKDEAERYAEDLHERTPLDQPHVPEKTEVNPDGR